MKKFTLLGSGIIKATLIITLTLLSDLFSAQSVIKNYATNESHSISTICLSCEVQNPQNAVGNNENDYSTLKIGAGLLGNISQTLKFPTAGFYTLSIQIGTNENELSISLLNSITIETMNGSTSNGDHKTLNADLLKLTPGSSIGIIEIKPTKPYDRVKISLNAGIITLNSELHIYYALQNGYTTPCATFPFIPSNYYSFNENTNDAIGSTDLENQTSVEYENNGKCGSAVTDGRISNINIPIPSSDHAIQREKTFSFWAKTNNLLPVNVNVDGTSLAITKDSVYIQPYFDSNETIKLSGNFSDQTFEHYSITTLPKYRSDAEMGGCQLNGGSPEGCSKPIGGLITLYKNGSLVISKPFISHPDIDSPEPNRNISLNIHDAAIDDLIIYNKVLSDTILKQIPCYYNGAGSPCSSSKLTSASVLKNNTAEESFIISPNPNIGQISLHGNVNLEGSEIFISNTSGKEVYRSKFTSKTFDLPATLPGGVYLLTLQTKDKKVYTRKIILTR